MQLPSNNPSTGPLDLPEIRSRIAYYLTRRDCLSCMRVSHDWFLDFVRPVWHTIDFSKDATAFSKVPLATLDNYGGFISEVLNITKLENVRTLQHAKVDSIKSMRILLSGSWLYRSMLSDLLRRSHSSITSLSVRCNPPEPNTFRAQENGAVHYMSVNDMFPPPPTLSDTTLTASKGHCLRTLSLAYVCLTWEGFSSMLQYAPALDELSLDHVLVIFYQPSIPLYTGSKLRFFSSSFAQAWGHDTLDPRAPHLLEHFPRLEEWHITALDRPGVRKPPFSYLVNFSACCPLLKTITFNSNNDTSNNSDKTELISELLFVYFKDLESCKLSANNMALSTAFGLTGHQETITSIVITDKLQGTQSMPWLYLIPKLCKRLQVLSLESFVVDMESIENHPWGCMELKELRTRFKDLDTPQDIDSCLKEIYRGRRSSAASILNLTNDKGAVLERVSGHLLQFKYLRTVWLGTEVKYLPLRPI
ncbi:hypothetical protein BGZ97_009976 [Linnemannia gamsii]|uniref:F-box domain-containing protein n=1 Tax=Linnemannia gamsii TaxID=64522 RepID=A0A9P6UPB9_9FUNG|nr:hypothetical protein BGZ97_009976 [Linnemannia gamsii]